MDTSFHLRYYCACLLECKRILKREFYQWSYGGLHRDCVEDFAGMWNMGGEL